MPRVTKLYESSRRSLEHNLGGFFGKPKKKEKPLEPKGKIKEVGEEAKSAIERRNEALQEAAKEPAATPAPTPVPEPVPKPKPNISSRPATMAMRKRREAFEKAEREKKK